MYLDWFVSLRGPSRSCSAPLKAANVVTQCDLRANQALVVPVCAPITAYRGPTPTPHLGGLFPCSSSGLGEPLRRVPHAPFHPIPIPIPPTILPHDRTSIFFLLCAARILPGLLLHFLVLPPHRPPLDRFARRARPFFALDASVHLVDSRTNQGVRSPTPGTSAVLIWHPCDSPEMDSSISQ